MKFSDNAMSAILLCSYIGITSKDTVKPLSLGEWNDFLDKVIAAKIEPGIVLNQGIEVLRKMQMSDSEIERIRVLTSRGGKAAFELDDLEKKGIGIVTFFEADYPVLLRRRLKRKAPPVLFYAGDIHLAKKIGIAVVGSRNVSAEGIEFTKNLAKKAAQEKLIIYSGGAKGVDITSEEAALAGGGAVVSFVADSLASKIRKKDTISNIMKGKLLLISDVKPDAGFTAARAMNRNKLIYASAYGAFVVSSDYNKGGTWTGATEAIRNEWTKVFVWNDQNYDGNIKLIQRGGISYDITDEKIYDIMTKKENVYKQLDIYSHNNSSMVSEENPEYTADCDADDAPGDLYDYVKDHIADGLAGGMSLNDAAKKFNVAKGQMTIWLKRLCKDELIQCKNGIYRK